MPATGNTANDSARNGMVTEESTFSNLLMSAQSLKTMEKHCPYTQR